MSFCILDAGYPWVPSVWTAQKIPVLSILVWVNKNPTWVGRRNQPHFAGKISSVKRWKLMCPIVLLFELPHVSLNINICGWAQSPFRYDWKLFWRFAAESVSYSPSLKCRVWRFIHCFIVQLMAEIHHPQLDTGYKRIWRRIGTTL
jgi:hypothetical protein